MAASNEVTSLEDKAILITGGARRVGAEIVRTLHAAGARILIHYRTSAEAAAALAEELNRARPGSAVLHGSDLLADDAPEELVAVALP